MALRTDAYPESPEELAELDRSLTRGTVIMERLTSLVYRIIDSLDSAELDDLMAVMEIMPPHNEEGIDTLNLFDIVLARHQQAFPEEWSTYSPR